MLRLTLSDTGGKPLASVEVPEEYTNKIAATGADIGTIRVDRLVDAGLAKLWDYALGRYGRDGCTVKEETGEKRDDGSPVYREAPSPEKHARKMSGLYGEAPIVSRSHGLPQIVHLVRKRIIKDLQANGMGAKAVQETGIGSAQSVADARKIGEAHGVKLTKAVLAKLEALADALTEELG